MLQPTASQLTSQTSRVGSHLKRIDVLRAVAILLVFSSHFHRGIYGPTGTTWSGPWFHWSDHPSLGGQIFRITLINGNLGVCLFFVISGLCIRLSHFSHRHFSLKEFYQRRFWRIYPPYALVLAVCVLLGTDPTGVSWQNLLLHVLMIHNLSITYATAINSPFWSLALEVQCYLLYPVLLFLHDKLGALRTALILGALAFLTEVLGSTSFARFIPGLSMLRVAPTTLWFTWYMGFLIADRLHAGIHLRKIFLPAVVPLLVFWALCFFYRPLAPCNEIASGLLLGLLVYGYIGIRGHLWAIERGAVLLGACSYSFYLIHYPLIQTILVTHRAGFPLAPSIPTLCGLYLAFLAMIGLLSWICYRFIEIPSIGIGKALIRKNG